MGIQRPRIAAPREVNRRSGHFVRSFPFFAIALTSAVLLLTFLTMPGEEYPGDAQAPRVQAIAFLNTGQWSVPREIAEISGERGHFFFQNTDGRWYPKYGALNTALYLAPLWLEKTVIGHLDLRSPDRVFFLNLLNVIFSGATALYLTLLARRQTASRFLIVVFVFAALFSTFWWNYLRGQTFEIFHAFFLLAFFHHFVTALDQPAKTRLHFLLAAIFLGALFLSKSVYVILLPAIGAILLWQYRSKKLAPRALAWFSAPIALSLCLIAFANWARFGSPFTTGYTQAAMERQLFTLRSFGPALYGFLFQSRYSVFIHFTLLVPALFGWPRFFRKHRRDAIVVLAISVTLLVTNSLFTNWRGEACYGPRYLLPILPLLSLPFLEFGNWLSELRRPKTKAVLICATALLLGYATVLQACVSIMPFFFCYDLKSCLVDPRHSAAATYLRAHNFGSIDRDFLLHRERFDHEFTNQLSENEAARFNDLRSKLRSNFRWFPRRLKGVSVLPPAPARNRAHNRLEGAAQLND